MLFTVRCAACQGTGAMEVTFGMALEFVLTWGFSKDSLSSIRISWTWIVKEGVL